MIRRLRRLAAEALDRRFRPLNTRLDAIESQLGIAPAPVLRSILAARAGLAGARHLVRAPQSRRVL